MEEHLLTCMTGQSFDGDLYVMQCWLAENTCAFDQAVIRAVCVIIDAFHFPTAADAAMTSAEGGEDITADISADSAEIETTLTKRVLPALQMHLVCCERHDLSFEVTVDG